MRIEIFIGLIVLVAIASAKHGGPRGRGPAAMMEMFGMGKGGHHGKKQKMHIPSAVDRKVSACLSSYGQGPVNLFINFNQSFYDRIPELMDEFEIETDKPHKVAMIKAMVKALMNSKFAPKLKKLMGSMMACHAAKFADKVMKDFPDSKVNIAFGSGETFHYIEGSHARESNWTEFREFAKQEMNMSELFDFMKMIKENMGPMDGSEDGEYESSEEDYMYDEEEWSKDDEDSEMGFPDPFYPRHHNRHQGGWEEKKKRMEKKMNLTTNVADNLKWGIMMETFNRTIPFTHERPAAFDYASFQIVITADKFEESVVGNNIDLIVDIMGRWSNLTENAGETNALVFIAMPPESVQVLPPSIRYGMCQYNGGVKKEQPPKSTKESQ